MLFEDENGNEVRITSLEEEENALEDWRKTINRFFSRTKIEKAFRALLRHGFMYRERVCTQFGVTRKIGITREGYEYLNKCLMALRIHGLIE